MKTIKTEDGYKLIEYKANELGKVIEPLIYCVMCGQVAFYIAEHNEPLCENCKENNNEARLKK